MKKSKWNPKSWFKRPPQVSVLRLYGPIGMGGRFSQTIAHAPLEKAIERAFEGKRTKAVALVINSPGGSPAQSGLIARQIRRIGSIGVISASFGAVEAIDKIGIERRVHTAGKSKSLMDPFREEKPEDVARLDRMLHVIHERFIAWVKGSRGARLKDDVTYFEGDIWVGQEAVDVGIADAVGHLRPVIAERFGKDAALNEVSARKPGLLKRLLGGGNSALTTSAAESAGAGAARAAVDAVEERALWARYGV
jgi:serine protease SohB